MFLSLVKPLGNPIQHLRKIPVLHLEGETGIWRGTFGLVEVAFELVQFIPKNVKLFIYRRKFIVNEIKPKIYCVLFTHGLRQKVSRSTYDRR